jgi:ribonuclease R
LLSTFISKINIVDRGGYVTNEYSGNRYYIGHVYLKGALDGDTVKVGIADSRQNQTKAKVESIVKRNSKTFTVKLFLKRNSLKASLYPYQSKSISIKQNNTDATAGDIVKIKILDWRENHKTAYAKIISLVSTKENINNDFLFITRRYRLNNLPKIPINAKVGNEYKSILENNNDKRKDLTDLVTITIDPDDAGDFDDAISVIKKDKGYYLFVHIADVSAYVKEGDSVDMAAKLRGNSYYFPEKVFHMLPKILSTDLCSLVPNKKRLAMSLRIELDDKYSIKNYSFFESIIKSNKRFTYSEASNILNKLDTSPYAASLQIFDKLTNALKSKRLKNAFNLDHREVVYNPNQLTKKERGRSHKIVEECMLIANKVAARKIINMNSDSHDLGLYRNHDLPSLKNENYIKDIMAKFSKQKIVSKKLNASSINEFLKKINDKSTRGIISFLLIRKMKKAFYSSKNIGHYGLGFDEYTHFTSPIRRYSDLLVHRLLKKQMKKKANIMESIDFCNSGEEKAKLASRDYLRLKGLRWLESRIDKSLQGVIIDIKSKYLVVNETSTEITGKIDIKNLPKDVYVLASNKLTLLGKYSKSKFGVGEKINIKVSQIDMINQDISFELKQG